MSYKKTLFTGTLILTLSGFLSRVLGFYNRIFLSNLIGAKELGIYQLIFPVYLLAFSLCCHGFETGISNFTSRFAAANEEKNAHKLVKITCILSFCLSVFLCFSLYFGADYLSYYLLKEASMASSLRIAALSLPFVGIKSCLHGYYIGKNKSIVPASSQLIEQITRVGSIYLLSITIYSLSADARIAVWGLVFGEMVSTIYTIFAYLIHISPRKTIHHPVSSSPVKPGALLPARKLLREFFRFSIPLTINHFSLTIVSSIEAILIPFMLYVFYRNQTTSLEVYGTLTGMAIPFLFFPATITNSLSVMLMPAISSSHKQKKMVQIKSTISVSIHFCIVIGIFATFAFLFFGNALGNTIFHSSLAGHYVYTFAVLCPFLYLSQTTSSILNGFGKTRQTLYHNLLGVGIRVGFILVAIPQIGMSGYLYGLLAGYTLQVLLNFISILKLSAFPFSVEKTLLFPTATALLGGRLAEQSQTLLSFSTGLSPWIHLGLSGLVYCLFFLCSMLCMERLTN